ncbi:MAG: hypothetical protein K2K12_02160 [Clostridia bacterium]|nr:hypothetical protein [Clostridia bacterium]
MTIISVISILISIIALLVSSAAYLLNVAKHNLQQLQTRYLVFCEKFQSLLIFGSQHQLTDFKYDLDNMIVLDPNSEECYIAFNNLQKTTGKNKDACKKAYNELCENLDFWETKSALKIKRDENDFITWLNEIINLYYSKLSSFYVTLFEINFIAKTAQLGVLAPKAIETIRNHYKNIREITEFHETLLALNREITGTFCRLSVRDIGFFSDNIKAIKKIEKYLNKWITQYGINDVIKNKDYSKISTIYKDFNESSLSYLTDEEEEFILFINHIIEMSKESA